MPTGHTSADIDLRDATREDVSQIAAIERASFSDPWSPASFEWTLRDPTSRVAVAAHGRDVLGYSVARVAADEGELANIAVRKELQRGGIGSALLEDALRWAWERGAQRVYLEVRVSNEPARKLYLRAGFAEVGRRKRYYTHPAEDALILMLAQP